jgi:ElaB/YqjD/DUF883 family membrane-anchored ribosome-binding protein
MARKSKASSDDSDDVAAVEELMQDLQTRLSRLQTKAKGDTAGGSEDIADFVSQTLASIAAQVRDTADAATDTLADQATEAGTDLIKKIWEEMQRHPLTTLALAAGAGYLLGLIGKQDTKE